MSAKGVLAALCLLAPALAAAAPAPAPDARQRLIARLDHMAHRRLEERRREVAALTTRTGAEQRRAWVRRTVLELIGGLPTRRTPLAAKVYGVTPGHGFRMEKIIYDSLSGYHVTADVFVPAGRGPFPAVIMAPGHGPDGKAGDYAFGANLARAGILTLAYDVVSEGERFQHYDPQIGGSKVGPPTGEHSMAFFQTLPTGEHVSRYFIWDAMRGLDYLAQRKDVDAARLGAFGCSGGGTVAAYLAALDDRVKAAAVACYIDDFDHLLASVGPQDAEQSIPGFIARGLDLPDWVEAAAPRPYAIVSTTEDMFPFAGAQAAQAEASRVYGLYGAADRLAFITGPGGHGALAPISDRIVGFFTRWLKDEPQTRPFVAERPARAEDVLVTPTGQLSTSLGGATLQSLNAARVAALAAPEPRVRDPAELAVLQARLQRDIRAVARVQAIPGGAPPEAEVSASKAMDGYRLDTLRLRGADGSDADGLLATPTAAGRHPAVLIMAAQPLALTGRPGGSLDRLAREGRVVLALRPSGAGGTEEIKSPLLGDENLLALRALLVDRTLLGLRVDDVIHAADWLAAQPQVDADALSIYGEGEFGPVALHAAVLDPRLKRIEIDRSLVDYRETTALPLARNTPPTALPGVLRRYDLPDLLLALSPRPVAVLDPIDAVGLPVREAAWRRRLAHVLDDDRRLGHAQRLRYGQRGARDPIPAP